MKTIINRVGIPSFTYDSTNYSLPDGYSDWPDQVATYLEYKYGHLGVVVSRQKLDAPPVAEPSPGQQEAPGQEVIIDLNNLSQEPPTDPVNFDRESVVPLPVPPDLSLAKPRASRRKRT